MLVPCLRAVWQYLVKSKLPKPDNTIILFLAVFLGENFPNDR